MNGMSEQEQKYHKQKNQINFLRRDNDEMNIMLKILNKQNEDYSNEITTYETDIRVYDEDVDQLRQQMRHKDIQIKNQRREANETKVGLNEQMIRNELEMKLQEHDSLIKKLEDLKQEEEKFDLNLREAELNYQKAIDHEQHEKHKLKMELEQMRNIDVEDEDDDNLDKRSDAGESDANLGDSDGMAQMKNAIKEIEDQDDDEANQQSKVKEDKEIYDLRQQYAKVQQDLEVEKLYSGDDENDDKPVSHDDQE